jgi:hypothetical protein
MKRHAIYIFVWSLVNGLLVVSILLAIYSMAWEYSTRRYLKGFSDAIVPLSSPTEEKVDAILTWMKLGPSRRTVSDSLEYLSRDPATTLNYHELLKTCGTATNAFVNLANTSHLPARRLLLLDGNWSVKHVVAEVELNDRWVVVDPSFRITFRDANGRSLTREEMVDPLVFKQATEGIPDYLPEYTFERTAHVRVAKLPYVGSILRIWLNRLWPGWSDSVLWTNLLERESFASMVAAFLSVICLLLIRLSLRWYGEYRLGFRIFRARERIALAARTLLRGPN